MKLDDGKHMRALDAEDMLAEIESLPDQLAQAWELGNRLPLGEIAGVRRVVLAGMGGSAIGADLLALGEVPDADTAHALMRAVDHGIPAIAALTVPDAGRAVDWFARKFVGQQRDDAARRVQRALSCVIVATSPTEAHRVVELPPRLANAS